MLEKGMAKLLACLDLREDKGGRARQRFFRYKKGWPGGGRTRIIFEGGRYQADLIALRGSKIEKQKKGGGVERSEEGPNKKRHKKNALESAPHLNEKEGDAQRRTRQELKRQSRWGKKTVMDTAVSRPNRRTLTSSVRSLRRWERGQKGTGRVRRPA